VLGTYEAVLAGLDAEQREVALATRGPVCVLAGAGTGKTRAITHRIAYAVSVGVVDPAHVLALTFTVRAAGELRGRLRQLAADPAGPASGLGTGLVRASTFHSAALRQLNYFWPRVVGGRPPQVIDAKAALVREAAKLAKVRLDGGAGPERGAAEGSGADRSWAERSGAADLASEIEWAKVAGVRPDGYPAAAVAAGRSPAIGADGVAAVYDRYERLRRERHLIDFESVLELTAAIIADDRTAADQVRDLFRYFVVDEYQDVNPLQKLLLDAWLGGRDELCVVGDPNQTIYSFTGATPSYLAGFTAEFPDATVVRLVRDYRSTPQVVAVANQLVRGGTPLIAQRPAGPRPVLTKYRDDEDEAAGVAIGIRALLAARVPVREIAVLVRINADTERFERALAEAGVPYLVRGAERFYERPIVRQALVLLRGAARGEATGDPGDRDPLPSAVRHVLTGIGFTGGPVSKGAGSKRAAVGGPALGGGLRVGSAGGPGGGGPGGAPGGGPGGGAARERWESLAALAQLADDMQAARPDATLADFAAELAARAELGHAPAVDGVTLASMHAAKGLEWDAVLLPGLVEGLMPIVHARTAAAIEEERRLLYVAVTRAREHLYLSWSPVRALAGRAQAQARPRSRFLDEVRLPGDRSPGQSSPGRGVRANGLQDAGGAARPARPGADRG
jgi:DNA helicase II / ATP-dependent DNA helicase PcrA